jgi:hypothetical protein
MQNDHPSRNDAIDVLIVGAGPTGLTLAAQVQRFGASLRIVDRALDRAHESRALAVQARTLEILETFKLGQTLTSRGNPSTELALHWTGSHFTKLRLGGFAANDTRFPFILFVSQAETEALLGEHLGRQNVKVERAPRSAAPQRSTWFAPTVTSPPVAPAAIFLRSTIISAAGSACPGRQRRRDRQATLLLDDGANSGSSMLGGKRLSIQCPTRSMSSCLPRPAVKR